MSIPPQFTVAVLDSDPTVVVVELPVSQAAGFTVCSLPPIGGDIAADRLTVAQVGGLVAGALAPYSPGGVGPGGEEVPPTPETYFAVIYGGAAYSVSLSGLLALGGASSVTSVAGRTGAVTLTTADIGGLGTLATLSPTGTADNTTVLYGDGAYRVPVLDGSVLWPDSTPLRWPS